ncbi:deaminase [Massilia sp. CCM 8695]|uniref:Deaminase n=1 Tax=Massilia frigida TaxID=2609281 RepID=A0ABX0NK08_9BURK|nr:dihydrofolate reductase family protein [Massilia frigida]NHZ82915.1 deaminase [Massilia frigida]
MRKLTSHLFISLDGVVEAPDTFVRPNLYADVDEFTRDTVAGQEAILLGRKTYQEWSQCWPDSTIEPFASFINNNPKFVVSRTLRNVEWKQSTLLDGDLAAAVGELKAQTGKTIGVHGSISLVQSLLLAGLLDELHFLLCRVMAGHGRRLLDNQGDPVQLDLKHSRATPAGLHYLVYTPRPST